jgi:transcriptional regulator with XRE-family HTH domain
VSTASSPPGHVGARDDDQGIGIALGRAIRSARAERKLSMRALAAEAGISQPFLSHIENGTTMPSVVTLFHLAKALGISPSVLFPSVPDPDPILLTRRGEGRRVLVSETVAAATSRVLSSGTARAATVQEYRIEAGPYVGEWFESDGEIVVYVVDGDVTVTIDGQGEWELGPGDSLAHPGSMRNRWAVPGPAPATVLLVYAVGA